MFLLYFQLTIRKQHYIIISISNMQETSQNVTKGYLYIVVQKFEIPSISQPISCHISLGHNAKCNTTSVTSGTQINEVFLMQVPQNPSRLVVELKEKEALVGDCRYDLNPFFNYTGSAHSIDSDIYSNDNQNKGTIKIKITYYSAQHGKLKLRIFHLSLLPAYVQKFKKGKLKCRSGIYVQSSPDWSMTQEFDHTLQLLVLNKHGNLEFQVACEEGVVAKYVIYDLQKSGLLIDKSKAYQVSLFNKESAVGSIKYQVDWLH